MKFLLLAINLYGYAAGGETPPVFYLEKTRPSSLGLLRWRGGLTHARPALSTHQDATPGSDAFLLILIKTVPLTRGLSWWLHTVEVSANTNHLYNICTMLDQRRADVVQISVTEWMLIPLLRSDTARLFNI